MWRVLLLVAACSKSEPPPPAEPPPLIPAEELTRGADACTGYVKRVCACAETMPELKTECGDAKPLPEALAISSRLATNPKAEREDAVQAAANSRRTVKSCIERTAKLPPGCP